MKSSVLSLLFLLFIPHISFSQSSNNSENIVFKNGESGYQCFRIPAIVRSPKGVLLAFAEGRTANCDDFGDVDIVLKTSQDNGKTWGALQVVADNGRLQASNAAPVFDLLDPGFRKGRLFLFYNTGNVSEQEMRAGKGLREVWYKTSEDEGRTWKTPVNITAFVHRPNQPALDSAYRFEEDWRSYANTPGHALQLRNGRLFVPANHSAGPPQEQFREYRAHAFYSDDHGKTWQLSPDVNYPGGNESTAAELPDGQVLMSVRNQSGDKVVRLFALSLDGGSTWDTTYFSFDVPDPVCEASLLGFKDGFGKQILLHSNLASLDSRCCLTVKTSKDQGRSWSVLKEIYRGSAAYSDLVQLDGNKAGILYERNDYSEIVFTKFEVR